MTTRFLSVSPRKVSGEKRRLIGVSSVSRVGE
jgi:hypothetical protein